jgi:hypothetical protein
VNIWLDHGLSLKWSFAGSRPASHNVFAWRQVSLRKVWNETLKLHVSIHCGGSIDYEEDDDEDDVVT